jgi:serine/threonine protein kinase
MSIYPSGTLIANRYEVVQGPREKPSLAGGMGLVYLCVDHTENGRPVALKTFRPELLPDRAARDRFLREGTQTFHVKFTKENRGSWANIRTLFDVIKRIALNQMLSVRTNTSQS